jgi:hypothetical protein
MSVSVDSNQLQIIYLFLSAENRISDADFVLFEEIGKTVEKFSDMKGEIVGECEKILATPDGNKTRFEIVSNLLSEKATKKLAFLWRTPEDNRSVLWSLISLLYQIEGRSENKEQLVETWAKKSSIDDSVFLEMHDTCKTQKEIVEYQKWLETSKLEYLEIKSIMQELDKNLMSLQQSVSDLIALG